MYVGHIPKLALLRDFYQKLLQNNWCDQVSQKNDDPPQKLLCSM